MDYFGLMLRGFAMGCSDVVPGVSGGTMAFILGIYEELIDSIRVVGQPHFLQAVFRFRIKEVFQILNWKFLGSVFLGIALAILTLARGLEWLLHNQPVFLWSFFFGLVLASVVAVSKRIKQWSPPLIGMTLIGTVGAFVLVGLVPLETPNAWWFYFLSGALAICAMILPGISGAFILVLLGKYMDILAAVNERDIVTIAFVGAGAIIGLVSFAQVLGWLFKRYHDLTVALLIGLMIGSLRKIWPWKDVVEFIERKGEIIPTIEHNILPALNSDLALAIVLGVIGFMLVMALDRWAGQAEH
jgi:putative membrane protein